MRMYIAYMKPLIDCCQIKNGANHVEMIDTILV